MLKCIKIAAVGAALCALASTGAESTTMKPQLTKSASVPLDFLTWVGKDTHWLSEALVRQGVTSGYAVSGAVLEATTPAALGAANRIRVFAHLAAPSLKLPYFDLAVAEGGATVRCVTLFPRSIAPGIGPFDFSRATFPAADADPAILRMCRVDPKMASAFADLDREAFREKYFDAAGDLKIDFVEKGADPAFLARAIDLGFFVIQQDFTGRPRLSRE